MKKILVKLMVFGLLFTITKCTVPDKPSMEQLRAAETDKEYFKQTVDSLRNQVQDSAWVIQGLRNELTQLINKHKNDPNYRQRIDELDNSLKNSINNSKNFTYETLKLVYELDSTILNRHNNVVSSDSLYEHDLKTILEYYLAFGQDVDTAFNKAEIVRKCQNRLTDDYSSNNQEALSRAEKESDIAFDKIITRENIEEDTKQPSNDVSYTYSPKKNYKQLYEEQRQMFADSMARLRDVENQLTRANAENARLRKKIDDANNDLIHSITITAIGKKAKKAESIKVKFKVNWPLCDKSSITIYIRIKKPTEKPLPKGIDDIICNCKNAMKVFDAIDDNREKKIGYSEMMMISSNDTVYNKSINLCTDEELIPGDYNIEIYYNKKVVGEGGGTIIKKNKDEWSIQK
ncbi:MAG: hypothetical protein PUC50_13135 [Bacteroidales bacterium]|nr:hypothetical protein [Bacteroidales bacterium]